ncbi:choice-of-anchor L domain-containing protein, partial [Aurantibacter sp.]|uniref:choice-of-anchor L domain-containing protein n=1 Tax=Aurantibacter sp. TaxID=2807103 RepID=UPI0035C7E01E
MKFFSIKKWCLICLLLISGTLFSQITIDNTTYSTTQLVDGILVPAASGTVITNVTYGGVYNNSGDYQIAQFTTAGTTLAEMGFNEGVVLTSGNTNSIPLALGVDPRSTQIGGTYSSCTTGEIRESGTCGVSINDLNVLAGAQNYFNASVLEFDFVPVENSVTFRYIFGSEEYQDDSGFINYQCSSYNDKFGFLISGPGIINVPGQTYDNNAVNIALLNNGSEVSINSVNDGVVGSSGGAPNSANCLASNGAWIENTPTPEFLGTIDGTNMNGNTRILSATKTGLTPGQTYHIKLIVTDINDGTYDSVVYLEAGSFTTELSCNAGATQNLCNATFATLAATSPATGNWTVVSGPNTPTFTSATNPNSTVTGLINGNYVFRWTATDLSCFADVSINNGTTPATPTITSVAPTCIADGTSTI